MIILGAARNSHGCVTNRDGSVSNDRLPRRKLKIDRSRRYVSPRSRNFLDARSTNYRTTFSVRFFQPRACYRGGKRKKTGIGRRRKWRRMRRRGGGERGRRRRRSGISTFLTAQIPREPVKDPGIYIPAHIEGYVPPRKNASKKAQKRQSESSVAHSSSHYRVNVTGIPPFLFRTRDISAIWKKSNVEFVLSL